MAQVGGAELKHRCFLGAESCPLCTQGLGSIPPPFSSILCFSGPRPVPFPCVVLSAVQPPRASPRPHSARGRSPQREGSSRALGRASAFCENRNSGAGEPGLGSNFQSRNRLYYLPLNLLLTKEPSSSPGAREGW